jgi:hypothetical protein
MFHVEQLPRPAPDGLILAPKTRILSGHEHFELRRANNSDSSQNR